MRKSRLVLFLVMVFVIATCMTGNAAPAEPKDTLYQVSTVTGLEHGIFFPTTTVGDLRQRGDTGVGAFEAMDGEMILLNGKAYNAEYSGKVFPVDDKTLITYSAVAFMNPNAKVVLSNLTGYAALQKSLVNGLPNPNIFYVFKIHGNFSYMKIRSTAKQELPYPGLATVVANQSVFEFKNITGTLVGVRCPEYIKGVYAPGFHLHFISDDLQKGGHVLDVNVSDASAEVGYLTQMHLSLPDNPGARAVDLTVTAQ